MSASINNNIQNLQTLNKSQSVQSGNIQKIASGSRQPSASFDPAAYSVLLQMSSNIGSLSQSNSNMQTANAMMGTAAGGISSTADILGSLQQDLLQAANGTNNASDLKALQESVNQKMDQISDNASIQFNGQNLLDGTGNFVFGGSNGYSNVSITNMSLQGLGLSDSNGKSNVDVTSMQSIGESLRVVTKAFSQALNESAKVGAAQQNMQSASSNYVSQQENLTAAAENSGSTDIASAVSSLKNSQTQSMLSLYASQLNNHNNEAVLSLLR